MKHPDWLILVETDLLTLEAGVIYNDIKPLIHKSSPF
jgi:hypothetical protein